MAFMTNIFIVISRFSDMHHIGSDAYFFPLYNYYELLIKNPAGHTCLDVKERAGSYLVRE